MSIIKKRYSPLACERKRDKRKAVSGGTMREGCGSTHSDRLNSRSRLFFFAIHLFPSSVGCFSLVLPISTIFYTFLIYLLISASSHLFYSLPFPLSAYRQSSFSILRGGTASPRYTPRLPEKEKKLENIISQIGCDVKNGCKREVRGDIEDYRRRG